MCNKRTFVKLDGHDVQGPTHLNQVAPFNLKFSTLSVHPLLVQFLKKQKRFQGTTQPVRKIGVRTPPLSSFRWLLLFERKSLLWIFRNIWADKLRGPDSTLIKRWTHPLPPWSLATSTVRRHSDGGTKAADDGGALKSAPHACYPPSPLNQSVWSAAEHSAPLFKPQWSSECLYLIKMNRASNAAWKEKTFGN